jgi:hypothetical protein
MVTNGPILLKKVRKRFEIFHLKKGIPFSKYYYNYNLFKLVDNESNFYPKYAQLGEAKNGNNFVDEIFDTEKECIDYLKTKIIKRLRSEGYKQRKDKIIQNSVKKVWSI